MIDYKKIAIEALRKANEGKLNLAKKRLDEGLVYPEGMAERMHPELEEDLANSNHSLGKHPIFPHGDEINFEQKIMGQRFSDVTKKYKRAHDVDSINNQEVIKQMMPMVHETMGLEAKHKRALEKLAERMIREEYNMDKDVVEIHAELVSEINMVGTKQNPKPMPVNMQFKNHDELVNANEEVYKRRFLNALTQGAAKKASHMFHMVDDELTDLDPRLPNKYAKMMASADYMYYVIPKLETAVNGGIVRVQFPTNDNPKAIIYAQAMVFPVLIHELVKGVMELLSAHGLPKNKKVGEFVINKADFLAAEPWDMRIGPALWERFTELIEPDDFHLKHQIYTDLASLPVREFNVKMREIMANTNEGKKIINNIVKDIKKDFQEDEFNEAMQEISKKDKTPKNIKKSEEPKQPEGFDFKDLLGGSNDGLNEDGYGFDELFK